MQDFYKTINDNDAKMRALYGRDFSQKSRRVITFIDATPTASLIKKTLVPPLVGMTVGGAIGGIIGMIGGPKGAAIGMGGGVGSGVGLLASGAYAGYKARKEYKKWLRQYRCDELLPEFATLFDTHPMLQGFRCPLTTELMHYPFMDPWGHSYEKKAIEAWIHKHKTSPVTKRPLAASELCPNYTMMGELAKLYREILEKQPRQVRLTQIQQEEISILLKDLEDQMNLCFYAENKLLLEMLKSGKITRRVYVGQLRIITDVLDR